MRLKASPRIPVAPFFEARFATPLRQNFISQIRVLISIGGVAVRVTRFRFELQPGEDGAGRRFGLSGAISTLKRESEKMLRAKRRMS